MALIKDPRAPALIYEPFPDLIAGILVSIQAGSKEGGAAGKQEILWPEGFPVGAQNPMGRKIQVP